MALDRLQEVNDTLGHHIGDQLLAQIGPRLDGALRGADTVARRDGDEFAVLPSAVDDLSGALDVASRLRRALTEAFWVEVVELDIDALDCGAEQATVRDKLRHASLSTTSMCLQVDNLLKPQRPTWWT